MGEGNVVLHPVKLVQKLDFGKEKRYTLAIDFFGISSKLPKIQFLVTLQYTLILSNLVIYSNRFNNSVIGKNT